MAHRESWPEKLALRKLLGCEIENHIPEKLRMMTKGCDNRITARELIQLQIHNNSYETISTPERSEGSAPKKINVYSDGSVKNPHAAFWRTGGIGVHWPTRSLEYIPLTATEKKFMRHRTDEQGYTAWNVYNDLQNSSTRTEIGAALMAMQPKTEINVGIDNKATVNIGNTIIKHQIRRQDAKLREENGGLRLGGSISTLHRESPFKRIWALMKNGDLWSFFAKSTLAKGPQAIRLTKVKGHATQMMVDEGTVEAAHKEGNDGADKGADKGAVEEQQELSSAARTYARRQWKYKKLMARVHLYIIHLRKAMKEKLEALKRQANPFGDKEFVKQLIPSHLEYADIGRPQDTESISTRKIEEHDETDLEERRQAEKIRCFIDNIRWKSTTEERGGITWIELYIYYILHGGGSNIEKAKNESPFAKTPSLQSAMANFKKRVRFVMKVSVDERDEWHLTTCMNISNRLGALAISSRQASIKGMPAMTEEDSKYITKALLAMRGVNQKVHKAAHENGTLKLSPKPFAYKGNSHAWMRNLKKPEGANDWTHEPALPDGPDVRKKRLSSIACPECTHQQSTKSHRLYVKVGFCQLTCQRCKSVTSTSKWRCICGVPWYKCDTHVHKQFFKMHQVALSIPKRGVKRLCTEWGIEQPMPKSRKHFDFNCMSIISAAPVRQETFLEPGSILAARFPHLAKGYCLDGN